jgi:hypothetical protein
MHWILAVLTLCALIQTATAQAVTSIDTELVKGRCRFIADDGEVGHYALKRCPGLAGSRVYTEAGVHSVSLSFQWGRRKALDVVKSDSIGTKLEWRGTGSRVRFKPHAVIVTVVVKDYDADKNHNMLGVLRMEPHNACLMAVVDETANKDALKLARTAADQEAAAFSCKGGKPKLVGASTRWTGLALGLEGDPPKVRSRR